MTTKLALILSTAPSSLGKAFTLQPDGRLTKQAVAQVTAGRVHTRDAPDGAALKRLLDVVTERSDTAICPAIWHGNADEQPFDLVTESELASMIERDRGHQPRDIGGVHRFGSRLVAARKNGGMAPSAWVLLDFDDPPGMPEELRLLNARQRLGRLEEIVPGISGCERVEYRASSARVRRPDQSSRGPTHAWLRISDPMRIDTLRCHITVATTASGLGFVTENAAGGRLRRTVVDTSVLSLGRLVFVSRPNVDKAPGLLVDDADVRVVNEGAGPLDVAAIALPDADALDRHHAVTGERLRHRDNGQGLVSSVSRGILGLDTEIIRRGTTRTMRAWLTGMAPGDKLRCEVPHFIRTSSTPTSEAGLIRCTGPGRGLLYDVGHNTTYLLPTETPLGVAGSNVVIAAGIAATQRAMRHRGIECGLAAPDAVGLEFVFVPKEMRAVDIVLHRPDEIAPGYALRDKLLKFHFRVVVWRSKGLRDATPAGLPLRVEEEPKG